LQVGRITDGVGHLLDRRGRSTLLIEQVNIVGAKSAQGAFHLLTDTVRPAVSIDADLLTRSLGAELQRDCV